MPHNLPILKFIPHHIFQFCVIRRETFSDMEQIGGDSPQTSSHSLEGFTPLVVVTQMCGGLLVILVIIWTAHYRNGFSWTSNPGLEFNWHPLLMIIGLVVTYANGTVCLKCSPLTVFICTYINYECVFPFQLCSSTEHKETSANDD